MLKALFVLKIFTFLSWRFGHVWERLHEKAEVDFKIYFVADWAVNNNYNKPIAQYL